MCFIGCRYGFNTQCNRQMNEAQPSCYWSSTPVYHKASPSPGACLTGAISQGAGTVDVLTVGGIMNSPPSKRGHASKEPEETCLWMFPLCSPGSSQSVTPLHAQDHLPEQRWLLTLPQVLETMVPEPTLQICCRR